MVRKYEGPPLTKSEIKQVLRWHLAEHRNMAPQRDDPRRHSWERRDAALETAIDLVDRHFESP